MIIFFYHFSSFCKFFFDSFTSLNHFFFISLKFFISNFISFIFMVKKINIVSIKTRIHKIFVFLTSTNINFYHRCILV